MNRVFEENSENKSFPNINSCTISDFCNKADDNSCIHFDPCELCKSATLDPTNVANASRLLQVNVCLKNVCPGHELTVGCIILDKCNTVLAFKSQTFTLDQGCPCSAQEDNLIYDKNKSTNTSSPCVDTNRRFSFILPDNDLCSPLDIRVKIIANYTHPC
ncbi:hypothetical protein [Clostridium sp. KNHs214]|uniref:hypothetical protein n=1 Tax=Clostridium sp. KNHs214 TaxID=1540257 RepID=UPI00054EAE00|nr:hypothetical protein [Clostridium sp. KNHs214]